MAKEMYVDGSYLKKNPTWHSEDSPWKAGKIIRMLERNNIHPKRVCEVGCGAGEILRQCQLMMDKRCRFEGYDISPQAYKLCKTKSNKNLHFKQKDFLQEKSSCFDLLLVIDVIEHLEDYYTFLRGIRSKGTYKIFHIPLDLSVQSLLRYKLLLKGRREVGHIHSFSKETALEILGELGYEVIDWFYTAVSVDFAAKSFLDYITRWPRKLLFPIHKDLTVRVIGGYSIMVLAK